MPKIPHDVKAIRPSTALGRGGKAPLMDIMEPEDCRTMAEVRDGVDAVDAALMRLLSRRFAYMRAAARIKQTRSEVRDERRKDEVIEAARRNALSLGVPVGFVGDFWERLVEASIAYELEAWDRLRREPED